MPTRKVDIFGIGISATDYQQACEEIIVAAKERRSYAMSALATHGLIEAAYDSDLRALINRIDLVTPDGQPVRWAMNLLHGTRLKDRVCGPDLTWLVCEAAANAGIGVYLFGSRPETLEKFSTSLRKLLPDIKLVGIQPDRFREATLKEDEADIRRINESGAGIILVGRGCPRQERWVALHRGRVQGAMLAVGAAFDYFAGNLSRAPRWMQKAGLEWFYRLVQEPRRLFGRYLINNTKFLWLLARELVKIRSKI